MKRAFDLFFSCFLLLVLLFPILLVAWQVKKRLGSPVIFTQIRPGLGGRPFKMYKFRSMAEHRGESALSDVDRLSDFGKWLRASSLDELPGLWNVVKGDMSLVGPRPLLMDYLSLYSSEQACRHEVRPGITGWAQVNGRNALSWEEKFALDVWYVRNRTLWLDAKILLLTVNKVLRRADIDDVGGVGQERFRGSK